MSEWLLSKRQETSVEKDVESWSIHTLLVGMHTVAATLEYSNFSKIKNRSGNSISEYFSQENRNTILKRYMHSYVYYVYSE